MENADRSQDTREGLLDAAARCFARKGYRGASVREIAEGAGVSQGSVFWHFGSKEALLFEVVDRAFAGWEEEVLAPLLGDGPAGIGDVVEAHRSFAERNPEVAGRLFFLLAFEALGPRPGLREAYVRIYERFRRHGRDWIRGAVEAGTCRADVDPDAAAAAIVGALAGIFLQALIGGDTIDLTGAHRDLSRILARGLAPADGDTSP